MKLKELIKDIEVLSTNAAPDTEISGISYDSRLRVRAICSSR